MTLVYVGLLGLGFTLLLSGVYNVPYIATVTSILGGNALPTSSSSGGGSSATKKGAGAQPFNPFPTFPFKIKTT